MAEPETIRQGRIEADSGIDDDEGYQESSTASLLDSITSEAKKGTVENGRVYANYGKHQYGLPIDEEELDRLDMNHSKYGLLMGDKHFLAPISEDVQHVLDIGTGTGIWAIDFADKYPSANVIGTDIAPLQPQWIPPNLQFQIDDAELEWTFPKNHFDFIHLRDMYHAIRNWENLVKQCFDHLKPGGWVEFAAVHPVPECDDGTLDKSSAYVEMASGWGEIGARLQCEPDSATKFAKWFVDAGFVNVQESILKIPCSPWPKNPRLKRIGAYELMNVVEGSKGFMLRGWTQEFGQTREELEMLIHRMRKELVTNKIHAFVPFYATIAQKPMAPSKDDD